MRIHGNFLRWVSRIGLLAVVAGSAVAQSMLYQHRLLYNNTGDVSVSPPGPPKRGVNWAAQPPATIPAGTAAHPKQFSGALMYGGVTRQGAQPSSVSGTFSANAANANWPRSVVNGSVRTILRAAVGGPYLSHGYDVQFGGQIRPPVADVSGTLLNASQSDYWHPEPITIVTDSNGAKSLDSTHASEAYYWSPHAYKAYASQAGQIPVIWRTRNSTLTALPSGGTNWVTHILIPPYYYPIKSVNVLVSSVPVQEPQLMLWTKGDYQRSGRPVSVPKGVSQVNFIYNSRFPETVAQADVVPGPNIEGLESLNRGTIEVTGGLIQAYNREGRIFMELLGESTSTTGARRQLGFEIIDVVREIPPTDVTIELGETVTPNYRNDATDGLLNPSPMMSEQGVDFAYSYQPESNGRTSLYAIQPTRNLSDYQVVWMRPGLAGLSWPRHFARYRFVWPADSGKYSHYVRPVVGTDSEAAQTAVILPSENNPVLEYQDPSNIGRPRAVLNSGSAFYTFLDDSQPSLRALLRYNTANHVGFERVFSWLDQKVIDSSFSDSISTNLDVVTAYNNFPTVTLPTLQTNYNTYLANRPRGVNGAWGLFVSDDTTEVTATRDIRALAASSSGSVLVAAAYNDYLYRSMDAGATWTPMLASGVGNWIAVAMSGEGSRIVAAKAGDNSLSVSGDGGGSWSAAGVSKSYTGVACSSDGTRMAACTSDGVIFTSANSGVAWDSKYTDSTKSLTSIALTDNGLKMVAGVNGNQLLVLASTNAGSTFTATWKGTSSSWVSVSCSADGNFMAAAPSSGTISISVDGGATWTARGASGTWYSVSIVGTGSGATANATLIATRGPWVVTSGGVPPVITIFGGALYTSSDAGTNLTQRQTLGSTSSPWKSAVVARISPSTMYAALGIANQLSKTVNTGSSWSGTSYLGGSGIASWGIEIDTIDPETSVRATVPFNSTTPLSVAASAGVASPFPSTVTVSGITNKVLAVRVKLNNVYATQAGDLDILLSAPTARYCTLISDVGGTTTMTGPMNFVIDDVAIGPFPEATGLAGGTYLATDYGATPESAPANGLTRVMNLTALLNAAVADLASPSSQSPLPFGTLADGPRILQAVAYVGERVSPPSDELGGTGSYFPGYINPAKGLSFNPGAYKDPFVVGFPAAAVSSIIPVNAIPNSQPLEVWWFRANKPTSLRSETRGFAPTYWPSVIGRYTLQYPDATRPSYRKIVLANNQGSGPLSSLEQAGSLYLGNTTTGTIGYNPNEEHALLQGGRVWALRDDLNVVSGTDFSSLPFVLLNYTAADGRPSMSAFEVIRETATEKFSYAVDAGTILQPPMPLPLMDLPVPSADPGSLPSSLNGEFARTDVNAASFATSFTTLTTVDRPRFLHYQTLRLRKKAGGTGYYYIPRTIDPLARTAQGVLSATAPLVLSTSSTLTQNANTAYYTYQVSGGTVASGVSNTTVWVASPTASLNWTPTVVSVGTGGTSVTLNFGSGVNAQGSADIRGATILMVSLVTSSSPSGLTAVTPSNANDWILSYELVGDALAGTSQEEINRSRLYNQTTFQDRKQNLWVYRGPHGSQDTAIRPFQFYYKTLPGFWFPSETTQPPVGSIAPYLRSSQSGGGGWVGASWIASSTAYGDALGIRYQARWPQTAPVLQMAETLTVPKRGLPAVRGQTSLEVLYQQSIYADSTKPSVVLHDPTVAKKYALTDTPPEGAATGLNKIPDSIQTSVYRGKTFFPQLPPHLADRFYMDPNDGKNGSLILTGEFRAETLGESYLLPNLLSTSDITRLKALCDAQDVLKTEWDEAIDDGAGGGVRGVLQTYYPNNAKPGTFTSTIPVNGVPTLQAVTNTLGQIVEVKNSDSAVDSYALTAMGPGIGYVTLISGDGLAFTPTVDPVSVKVVKVVSTLYRGEAKVILSSNPLAEKVTVQQIADAAGQTGNYDFEWWIAAPVDGAPPAVYQSTAVNLLNSSGSGTWSHLQYPTSTDQAPTLGIGAVTDSRWTANVINAVVPVESVTFSTVANASGNLVFTVPATTGQKFLSGSRVTVSDRSGNTASGNVVSSGWSSANSSSYEIVVTPASTTPLPDGADVFGLYEAPVANQPQSILYRDYTVSASNNYSQYYLSLSLDDALGAKVYINGELAVTRTNGDTDTAEITAPTGFNPAPLRRVYALGSQRFAGGVTASGSVTHRITVELYSSATPGTRLPFQCQLDAYQSTDRVDMAGSQWIKLDASRYPDKIRTTLGEQADVRALSDNYLVCRYRANNASHPSYLPDVNNQKQGWSQWTEPVLVEGWIKRVLAGINPFNQRTTDLFNNTINTDANILTTAGKRWEGDVALNLDAINDYGLIEIYETVLRRGKDLSINAGISYDPANDALLLAAGYLSDLYMLVGNEARSDAANPTIGIGTKDRTYGDIATALFSFKGQLPTLLEEELALLRGRDDFLQPGVRLAPVYNRLVWNYTRGIDSGEVIYSLNYNILDQNSDGKVDAADAARLYPQGHGDAYGHYLTAIKGYYSLLLDRSFAWVPRIEAVNILGKAVAVDYQDERKFATAAAAVVRTGKEVFDLTWRRDYLAGRDVGWAHFENSRQNSGLTPPTTRQWGMDHWAARTGQGAYLHWAMGNSILPPTDPNPLHEGIQKVDRTTVPELQELATSGSEIQTAMDNAEALMTPLAMPSGGLAFDLNPDQVTGANSRSHFEQIQERALNALANAVASFDDAKDVTRLMRSEQDSLADLQNAVEKQELAYTSALIELYGTPYPDDVGPGKLYKQGYEGPDLYHYQYVETLGIEAPGVYQANEPDYVARIDLQALAEDWSVPGSILGTTVDTQGPVDGTSKDLVIVNMSSDKYEEKDPVTGKPVYYLEYALGSHGFFGKPKEWTSRRKSPGRIQQAISELIQAHDRFQYGLAAQCESDKQDLDKAVQLYQAQWHAFKRTKELEEEIKTLTHDIGARQVAFDVLSQANQFTIDNIHDILGYTLNGVPSEIVVGLANGMGTLNLTAASAAIYPATIAGILSSQTASMIQTAAVGGENLRKADLILAKQNLINDLDRQQQLRAAVVDLGNKLKAVQGDFQVINEKERIWDDTKRRYASLVAEGDRLQQEREVYRKRAAALIQGYRTRDAAFRIFRNEKLERYKTLFDLASRYTYLAANAYDYDTGLLNTAKGKAFLSRIVNSRALGVVKGGIPQYAGSNNGDPGLSSVLAEMKADWDVLKGRLGFNNPTSYGTTFSLRTEKHRILPTAEGANAWKDVLNGALKANILEDFDVKRYCMQVGVETGAPMPGLVVEFETTIADGLNFFGQPLQGWDHSFDSSAFATKIFAAGIALEGYIGMDNPVANSGMVSGTGSVSPGDPDAAFNDPRALAATPGVYLIPVGLDSMRSPALGDQGNIRTWSVDDVAIPLPFNLGGSDFSSKAVYQSSDSLTEPLFTIRKHASFRPVSTTAAFSSAIYGPGGSLQRSQFTNTRLVGRSVWNSKWKLVIPGIKLFHDPDEGLRRFIDSVTDIKLHLVTYSYSGN